jgi:8-oxo-dGTP diphosphatase
VFLALGCDGTAIETPEARPIWTPIDSVPYHEMWADDIDWLPMLIVGRPFRGFYLFEGEEMLSKKLEEL